MLNRIIPPEIKNDEFYDILFKLGQRSDLKTYLEIGSSSGQGSTEAFVQGIRTRNDKDSVRFFCMEISKERFDVLAATYRNDPFVRPYRLSSIPLRHFPSSAEVLNFIGRTRTVLNNVPLATVIGWLEQDLNYIRANNLDTEGIEIIKQENSIHNFDMVLIDGSEFTGEREFHRVVGAKVIALDDINAHKCFTAFKMINQSPAYRLSAANLNLRNGYAVFERLF